ncbi:MAG: M23 family metallopeptidase [Microgenomates group bacterium]
MKKSVHKWKIFKGRVTHRVIGMQFAGIAMALSLVTIPTHAFDYNMAQAQQDEVPYEVVMTTNSQYAFPLERTLGMSQGFQGVHRGVDFRAPVGTGVLAMAEGTVVEVGDMIIGYGHFVRVAHKGTVSTLYAHLDKVKVKPGQKLGRGENMGTVGMTGWTTGPHLHFEVHSGEKAVNPTGYISIKPFDH